MRSCRSSTEPRTRGPRRGRALALAALLGAGCAGGAGPEPELLVDRRPPRAVLADATERQAARVATSALAGDLAAADAALEALREGDHPSGVADNAEDVRNAALGLAAYLERAEQMLERRDLDAALRLRLETQLAQRPLERAERELAEDRRYKTGAVVNRVVGPLSRATTGAPLDLYGSVRAAVASIRVLSSFPEITPRERKALREWEEFLARNPDAPEAAELAERVQSFRDRRSRFLHDKAVEAARRALEIGSAHAALAHLERAERLLPEQPEAAALRQRASSLRLAEEWNVLATHDVAALAPGSPDDAQLGPLAVALLGEPADRVAALADAWAPRAPGALSDELAFASNLAARAGGDEDGFTAALEALARSDSNMARHARTLLDSPDQNPHAFYRTAVADDRSQRTRWLLLGSRSAPKRQGWSAPFRAVLELPARVIAVATGPLRWVRYPGMRPSFGDDVLVTGERYLERFPQGAHAPDVHRRLERLYAQRSRWASALEHHERGARVDPDTAAGYRERIADQTLRAAHRQPRIDVQVALLRSVLAEYPDTEAAAPAREALRRAVTQTSAQRIRVSRAFLLEFPELWAPAALGLRPELFDEERDNGEIAEDGIFLLGRNLVEIALERRDPLVREIPEPRFAHFVAALEEASYRQLATDARGKPQPDPQRDLFFERARLGLLDRPDLRPSARSRAEFLSTRERHGPVTSRESILPVELVVRGDLDTLGLAAFPRVRLPDEDPEDFLYE